MLGLPRHSRSLSPLPAVSRRVALAAGGLGFLSAATRMTIAREAAVRRARSVIMIFNCGAPSHIDLWDMKPNAPDNVRGEFSPISTKVAGIQISELLPGLAQRVDKLAILRSLHHEHSAHNSGMYWTTVGRPYPMDNTLINPSRTDYPCFGTLIAWLAEQHGYRGPLPASVITSWPHSDSNIYITPGQYGSCLGPRYDPLVMGADPNAANFSVPNLSRLEGFDLDRLRQRQELLANFEVANRPIPMEGDDIEVNRAKAFDLMTSDAVGRAFDLTREPDAVRDRYGRHTWGQSHLLARRLVEAGVPFVSTVNGRGIVWDTHQDNFNRLKNELVPPMEKAYIALLDDLEERGLLDTTLVAWMSDFGRTPLINAQTGRDHWPQCYTMVLAGGGIRGGQVVGSSDKIGGVPLTRPLRPADVHATIFSALGYDARHLTYHQTDGRPTPVTEGDVIPELFG